MSDQQHLHDAFAEYERRADAVGATRDAGSSSAPAARPTRVPILLVAASIVLVLAVAGGVMWLATGSTSSGSGRPAAGAVGSTALSGTPRLSELPVPSSSASHRGHGPVVVTLPPVPSPRSSGSTSRVVGPKPPSAPPTSSTPTGTSGGAHVPANAAQMERALRTVLGNTATFTVTETYGNYITGILTTTATGAKGGFDIQAASGEPGDMATCEDPGKHSHCTTSIPADGGSLAVERETFGGGKDVLYYVDYVHPNGATYGFHLSNRADPKGAGKTFGAKPPLTPKQLTKIIESDGWGRN